ncbi:MAG: hypothetical protein AAF399_22535 [Bacteroidota bacterium]
MTIRFLILFSLSLLGFSVSLLAQSTNPPSVPAKAETPETPVEETEFLRVFLDCSICDFTYLRQELNHIAYVRDPMQADVHVLVTQQSTGGGSRMIELDFIGKEDFANFQQTLHFAIPPNTARDAQRKEFARMFTLGLVPYLAQTDMVDNIEVRVEANLDGAIDNQNIHDPWGLWVFEVSASGSMRQEEQRHNFSFRGSLEANRVTEMWRIRNRLNGNFNQQFFTREGEEFTSGRRYMGYFGGATRSLSDHFSTGAFVRVFGSTYSNMNLSARVGPAIEYSLFPYSEVHRREITFAYHVGVMYRDYIEQTIFGKMGETLAQQSLRAAVRFRQPWGSVFMSAEGSHFFHDFSRNRIEFDGFISLRVAKGLSVSFNGDAELIHDQLSLASGEASLEDLLLQQTQLATGYRLGGSVGINYTFGSIYNNIVNTRL